MKAVVQTRFGLPKYLEIRDIDIPEPKPNEVLVEIVCTSINDWDWGLITGKPFITRLINGGFKPIFKIAGVDVSGKVLKTGKNVTKFREGDRVYGDLSESGFGAFAEYTCARESAIAIMPEKMSFEEAAALPHAANLATQGLFDYGKVSNGQTVLVNGAGGGVGTQAIQMLKELDVEVTGVDSASKLDKMKSLGYDHVVDFQQEDFTSMGIKYDLILDPKTNRPMYKYMRCLKRGGRYITVGGDIPKILGIAFKKHLFKLFTGKVIDLVPLKPNKDMDKIASYFNREMLKPVMEGPYTLQDIPEVLQKFGEGRHQGKVIIKVSP